MQISYAVSPLSCTRSCLPQDLLLFIDQCHETYVANLWLLISSYQEMFLYQHQDPRYCTLDTAHNIPVRGRVWKLVITGFLINSISSL